MNDRLRNNSYRPDRPIRVHEVERLDLTTGKSIRFRGLDLFRNKMVRTILTEVLPNPSKFDPTETDGGLRLEVHWTGDNVKWWIYGSQKPVRTN